MTQEIDLTTPEVFTHRRDAAMFSWLRANDPVSWQPPSPGDSTGFWAVTRYADVVGAARDPELFMSGAGTVIADRKVEGTMAPTIHHMDPPDHKAFRKVLVPIFSPSSVLRLKHNVAAIFDPIVKDLYEGAAECDFVSDVAVEFPLLVIGEILGVPPADRHLMVSWTNRLATPDESEYGDGARSSEEARTELVSYFHELCDQRRRAPREDVISALVHGLVNGRKLTQAEIDSYLVLVVVGGNETTRNTIATGMLALLEHPDQLHRALTAEVSTKTEVDEILRWTSTVIFHRRTATRDTELGGRQIRGGDKVVLYWASANRDETVFERADEFDLARTPNPHLTFGSGPHFCLGMHLAKLELSVAFQLLHERFPHLQPAGEPEFIRSHHLRGLKRMPVTLRPGGDR